MLAVLTNSGGNMKSHSAKRQLLDMACKPHSDLTGWHLSSSNLFQRPQQHELAFNVPTAAALVAYHFIVEYSLL